MFAFLSVFCGGVPRHNLRSSVVRCELQLVCLCGLRHKTCLHTIVVGFFSVSVEVSYALVRSQSFSIPSIFFSSPPHPRWVNVFAAATPLCGANQWRGQRSPLYQLCSETQASFEFTDFHAACSHGSDPTQLRGERSQRVHQVSARRSSEVRDAPSAS